MVRTIIKAVLLFVLFAVIWLLWSGLYKPLVLGLGAMSCALAVWIFLRMSRIDGERLPLLPLLGLLGYWPWLIKEIAKSNIALVRIVLSPSLPIDPVLFKLKATQPSPLGKVIYGNSITLTPGTVTTDIDDDVLRVHALTRASAEDLRGGEMDRRVTATER